MTFPINLQILFHQAAKWLDIFRKLIEDSKQLKKIFVDIFSRDTLNFHHFRKIYFSKPSINIKAISSFKLLMM
jgi:hypothetical protein